LTSKAGSAITTSVLSGKLSKNDSRVFDPFDDDFEMEHVASQSRSSSQTTNLAASSADDFDDDFGASTSQSQSSLALSASK